MSRAALSEAGWFVTASVHDNGAHVAGVLQPHDVIQVEGMGAQTAALTRLASVTHIINAADQFISQVHIAPHNSTGPAA